MTAKRQTKKSLIEQIHSYPDYATLDVNGMTMKELRDLLKLAEAGVFDTTEMSAEEIDAILKPAKPGKRAKSTESTEPTEPTESDAEGGSAVERTTIRLQHITEQINAAMQAENEDRTNALAEAVLGPLAAKALEVAKKLQRAGKPLELTPSGLYVRMVTAGAGAYVTADGSWVTVKDERGAKEKLPWTLYQVSEGTLRERGFFRSSEQAFHPEGPVAASLKVKAAA